MKPTFLLITYLLAGASLSFGQSHWERDFSGLPVREELILTYEANEKGEPGQLNDSTRIIYYADGKIKSIHNSWFVQLEDESLWNSGRIEYIYRNDTLNQINQYYRNDLSQVQMVHSTVNKIFPKKLTIYGTEIEAHIGDPEDVLATQYFEYNKNNDPIEIRTISARGEYKEQISYRKNLPQGKEISYDDNKDTYTYKYDEFADFGWSKRQLKSPDKNTVSLRSVEIFEQEELNNPEYMVASYYPGYTIDQLYQKIYLLGSRITDEKLPYLDLLIDLIERNPQKLERETSYDLSSFYLEKINYHSQRQEYDEALGTTQRALKYVMFGDEEKTARFEEIKLNLKELKKDKL